MKSSITSYLVQRWKRKSNNDGIESLYQTGYLALSESKFIKVNLFKLFYLFLLIDWSVKPILSQDCELDKHKIWGLWFSDLPSARFSSDLMNNNEDLLIKHPLVWSALTKLLIQFELKKFYSSSSDLKTILVANFCSKSSEICFYEFKIINNSQNGFDSSWLVRKELRTCKY